MSYELTVEIESLRNVYSHGNVRVEREGPPGSDEARLTVSLMFVTDRPRATVFHQKLQELVNEYAI